MPPSAPFVVAIILNWNDTGLTLDTLASLQGQSYPRLQTIVIDNGSSNQEDALRDIKAAFPHVRTVASKRNLGFAGGCNLGMRLALKLGADYLLLLNNDVILHPDAVAELVSGLQANPSAGLAAPLIYYAAQPDTVWWAGGTMLMGRRVLPLSSAQGEQFSIGREADPRETEWLPGTAMLASRIAVEQAGLMDARYFLYWEDVDWCYKMRHAGYGLLFVPHAVIWHKVNASTGRQPAATVYYWERNRLRFIERWGDAEARLAAWGKILWRSLAWRLRPPAGDAQVKIKLEAYRDYLLRRSGQRRVPR